MAAVRCERGRRQRRGKWRVLLSAGGSWGVNARAGLLGHTRRGSDDTWRPLASTRRANSAWCRPLNLVAVHSVKQQRCLTAGFQADVTANPWLQSVNSLNRICRPMYQLQLLSRDHALIHNQNRVISSQRSVCQAVSELDLEIFVKC